MKIRQAMLAATLLSAPASAMAQPISGVYLGAGFGGSFMQDQNLPGHGRAGNSFGGVGVGSVGWGFGNGVRVELQGDWRDNKFYRVGSLHAGGDERQFGGFVNALYDIDPASYGISSHGIKPYIGAGVGYERASMDSVRAYGGTGANAFYGRSTDSDGDVAFQGILGASYDLGIPGLAATAEYRFTTIPEPMNFHAQTFSPGAVGGANVRSEGTFNHAGLIGLRYAFNGPVAAAAPAPAPVSTPPVAAARTYMVFFDWDRADLTERARQIIDSAAKASTAVRVTRIDVDGYADASGTQTYNMRLSQRRAESVEAELVRDGVARNEIVVRAHGDKDQLVPTAAGVREPQNRRVEIVLR